MTEDRIIDTEPDDAFALVLGDIDSSPLMRSSPLVEAGLTPPPVVTPLAPAVAPAPPSLPEPAPKPAPEASETAELAVPAVPAALADPAEPTSEPSQPLAQTQDALAGERMGGGLFSVKREGETALVSPKLAMLADAAIPLQRLLRELAGQGVKRVTLDLANAADMDADCLAVLIAFAGSATEPRKLRLANANAVLSHLFQTVRLDHAYAVDLD